MKNPQLSEFLQTRIEAGDFPSAVYLVAEKGEIVFEDALGLAVVEPERIEARIDTIYDLASLTKVLVTGLLCAQLIEAGEINLSDTVSSFVRDLFSDTGIKFLHLLTHTSGCPAWLPFYLLGESDRKKAQRFPEKAGEHFVEKRETVQRLINEQKPETDLDSKVIYSDLNFIGLGIFLEHFYSGRLDEIAKKEIFEPLNLKNTFFNPPQELQKRIAASEKGNEYEKRTCIEQGYLAPAEADVSEMFRDHQIWGEVHDGNCYFMDGVSGHAGLFSTARETFLIAQQFLAGQTRLLQPETCRLFRTNFTEGLNEARSLAFQLAATPDSTASDALVKDSFGHLGFTGTSLWIEPERERIFILLTNRTHARPLPFVNINSVRRRFHLLASGELNKI
jgi:CubicO group peptidase (beta-lactamase class C family)